MVWLVNQCEVKSHHRSASYLSRLLMEEVPLSMLLSTSPVRLSRCQRRDKPCRWENKHTCGVVGEGQRETLHYVMIHADYSH